MINALNGKLVQVGAHSIIINTSGVEYYVEVSTQCASFFSTKMSEDSVRLLTTLVVREDAMLLFGFKDEAERECFTQLQTVPGVGAKQSMKILSSITVPELIGALDRRDVSRLSRIPGVGAKSAQKLILQLRDTLVYTDDSPSGVDNIPKANKQWDDLVDSLAGMGFDKKTVIKALDVILKEERAKIVTMPHEEAESHIFPLLLRRLS